MSPRKPTIKPRDVQGAKFLEQIVALLRPLHDHRPDPKRTLHFDEMCAWLLLYFFSPILTSLRALQQASTLAQLQRQLKLPRFSLGSFSESAAVFDPELLVPIMEQLGEQLSDIEPDPRLATLERRPTAVDGTLLHALPQMLWALWLDEDHRAAKLLELDAELLALLYRHRWQIELFFRWFKKVLQADRLLALSQNGMTLVAYCALIASMLVVLWTGRKPTKRTFELLCFYFSGWVSDEELQIHLSRLESAGAKK